MFRQLSMATFASVIFLGMTGGLTGYAVPFGQAVKHIDELLHGLARSASKADEAAESAEALSQTLRRMRAVGNDISPSVARALQQHYRVLPPASLGDDTLLLVLSAHDDLVEPAIKLACRHPVAELGRRVELLHGQSAVSARSAVNALANGSSQESSAVLLRALGGRQVSSRQLIPALDEFAAATSPRTAGDVFEVICREQISRGSMKPLVSLKSGTRVLDGRHNGVHGLDGVGVWEDGCPCVFEFTINRQKDLAQTGQLSPAWVADRWNRMLAARPETVKELREMGLRDEYLKPVNDALAKSFHRKLIGKSPETISGMKRQAVDLSMDDLLYLGQGQ